MLNQVQGECFFERQYGTFQVKAFRMEEYDDPRGHFATGDDELDAQIISDIECGNLDWFAVKVAVIRNGKEIGTDYLGGCCYKDLKDFVEDWTYLPDMVREAFADARRTMR